MKTLLFILLFNISAISFAQDPKLFENEWFLHNITIGGTDYFPPGMNGEAAIINLSIEMDLIGTTVCDTRGAEITDFDDINNSFSVGSFSSLAIDCLFIENQIFQDLYFNDFYKWEEPSNTYHYIIEEGLNSTKSLTLTNEDGNQAIYGDEILSSEDFQNSQFAIYPNPTKEKLFLSTTNAAGNVNVKIFSTEGKLLSVLNVIFENQTPIDVSNLTSGIYFLHIEDENGNTTIKKFIKE